MRKFLILTLFLISVSVFAQDNPTPPPISSENFLSLQSVGRIDFEDGFLSIGPGFVDPNDPKNIVQPTLRSGWFAMNPTGDLFVLDNTWSAIRINDKGEFQGSHSLSCPASPCPITLIDVVYNGRIFVGVYTAGGEYRVFYTHFGGYGTSPEEVIYYSPDIPKSIWSNCDEDFNGICYPWMEITDLEGNTFVTNLPHVNTLYGDYYIELIVRPGILDFEDTITLPYAPAQDDEAIVRIGRIPPPYVVTSSIDGIVKLWNLETGETVYEVDNGTGQAAVFGNINADATHLVWRDHGSDALYLLNFETGENRFIDNLYGGYVQWFFLSNDASLIIAVNYNFEPNIVVWDVETGERTILGDYRQCGRPQPDMARLSADGTTLVIGCDTGLDIWRIVEE